MNVTPFSASPVIKKCTTCKEENADESTFGCSGCEEMADGLVHKIVRLVCLLDDELHNGSRGAVMHSASPDVVLNLLSMMAPSAAHPEACEQDKHFTKDMTPATLLHIFSSLLGGSDPWYITEHLHAAAGRPWWPVFFNAVGATAHRLEVLTGGGIETEMTDVRCIQEHCDGYLERADIPIAMLDDEAPGANRWACHSCYTGYSRVQFAEAVEVKAEKARERIETRREELQGNTDDWLTVRDAAIITGRTKAGINLAVGRDEIATAMLVPLTSLTGAEKVHVFMPDVLTWSAKRKAPVRYVVPA